MDGSAWCFGCHHRERGDRIPIIDDKWLEKSEDVVLLDDDLCSDFPVHVVSWLAKYDITVEEAIKHGWKYGPKRDQLVFIFRDEAGNPTVTQARNFWAGAKSKYYNQGSPEQILPIFRFGAPSRQTKLVVVEDSVSAAKIARQCDAMPCLGSYLPKRKQNALRLLGYEQLVVWLDADKLREARQIADQAKLLGFETKVVHTEKDPKEYENVQIAGWIQIP
jgi:hypothetical protein